MQSVDGPPTTPLGPLGFPGPEPDHMSPDRELADVPLAWSPPEAAPEPGGDRFAPFSDWARPAPGPAAETTDAGASEPIVDRTGGKPAGGDPAGGDPAGEPIAPTDPLLPRRVVGANGVPPPPAARPATTPNAPGARVASSVSPAPPALPTSTLRAPTPTSGPPVPWVPDKPRAATMLAALTPDHTYHDDGADGDLYGDNADHSAGAAHKRVVADDRPVADDACGAAPAAPPAPAPAWPSPGPNSAPAVTTARPRRRWPWATTFAVLLAGLAATGLAWRSSYQRATEWQARALERSAELAKANTTVSEVERDLSDVRARLAQSETDARSLQGRLDALAAEKAKVEDEKEAVETVNQRLEEVTTAINKALQGANACIGQGVSFFQQLNSGALGAPTARIEADRINAICQQAEAERVVANRLIDALPKS